MASEARASEGALSSNKIVDDACSGGREGGDGGRGVNGSGKGFNEEAGREGEKREETNVIEKLIEGEEVEAKKKPDQKVKRDTREKKGSTKAKENVNRKNFLDYYQAQNILTDEADWAAFGEIIDKPLPVSFRIIGDTVHGQWVRECLKSTQQKLKDDQVGSAALRRLEWYSEEGEAWELKASRAELRSNSQLAALRQFLVRQSENGTIVRQEGVSMIPALALLRFISADDAKILDLCAAPGSKTSQLLEALNRRRTEERKKKGLPARGAIVANDVNSTRAHMLIHRLRYLASPCLLVLVNDASTLPRMYANRSSMEGEKAVKFDATVADVPCSGDGTSRKSQRVLAEWSPLQGLALHKLQMKILKRALLLTKVGGHVSYSTCSLNPVENEAVVAGILRKANAKKECLRVCRVSLPAGLSARPGLTSWRVPYKNGALYDTIESVPATLRNNKLFPSMFQPSADLQISEDLIKAQLRDTLRFYPQDNDMGGFYVAIFEKLAPLPWEFEEGIPPLTVKVGEETTQKEKTQQEKKVDQPLPLVQQKDMLWLTDDVKVCDAFAETVLKPYSLEHASQLTKFMCYRSPIEASPETDSFFPRKIWIVSEGVASLLNTRTYRAPLKVPVAGTQICDARSLEQLRFTADGFKLLMRHCYAADASYRLIPSPLIRYFTLSQLHDLMRSQTHTQVQNPQIQSKSECQNQSEVTDFCVDKIQVKSAETVAEMFAPCPRERHAMVIIDTRSGESPVKKDIGAEVAEGLLCCPVYVGRKNVSLLLTESVLAAVQSLVSSTMQSQT